MQVELWQILVLAIVQGITEFLPISSSGHVVILAHVLSPNNITELEIADLNICLHIGTLFSIVIIYFRQILRVLSQDRRMIGLVIVATLPAVVVGVPLKVSFSHLLEDPLLAGCLLIVTGFILLRTKHWLDRPAKGELDYRKSLLIGTSQAAAILPGLSRSGATISTGIALGLPPNLAASFSFLMAIPAIAGGGVLEIVSLLKDSSGTGSADGLPVKVLAIGGLVSFVVGVVALRWLLRALEQGRFHWFAWWCIPVGLLVIVWQLVERRAAF